MPQTKPRASIDERKAVDFTTAGRKLATLSHPAISGQASSTAEFPIPAANSQLIGITADPVGDNDLWFTESATN
jgi:hypothetical protein